MSDETYQAVAGELARLAKLDGRLTPTAVVLAARDPANPMHAAFEWDDARAGHAYRLWQARRLITTITLPTQDNSCTLRAPMYVRDPKAGPNEQGYVALPTARGDRELARAIMANECARAEGALLRARAVAGALGVEAEVDRLVEGVAALRLRAAA